MIKQVNNSINVAKLAEAIIPQSKRARLWEAREAESKQKNS